MNNLNKLLSNQREEGFSGKNKNKRRNIHLLELSFLLQRTSKSTKGGGPSPLNICNIPYFLRR